MGVDTYRKGRLVSRSQAEVSLGDGLGNNDLCFVEGGGCRRKRQAGQVVG